MAANVIKVPSFNWSVFYYGEILEALILYKRENLPELTDESDFEPFIQFLRAAALVGHLNNTLIDMIANECTLPTAQLPETIRNMLRLIGYEMRPATPAQADVVFQLTRPFNTSTTVVPQLAQVATQQSGTTPAVPYECLAGITIDRSDQLTSVLTFDGTALTYTDNTTNANAIGGANWNWIGTEKAGDMLYIGHSTVMWDQVNLVAGTGSVTTGPAVSIEILEYYDGDFQNAQPTSVTNIGGGQLQFDVTSLLGPNNRAGATVRVQLQTNASYQDVVSTWNGTTNIVTTGLLGQSVPSTNVSDYGIGTDWRELPFTVSQSETQWGYTLPQDLTHDWNPFTVNGIKAFWLRIRVVSVSGSPTPGRTFGRIRIDQGKQYVIGQVVQGKSVLGETLGSSTGAPGQMFTSSQTGFILNSDALTVDAVPWTNVLQLLTSAGADLVYRVQLGPDNVAQFVFGDGKNGAIPDIGQGNIQVNYRYGADDNGNVGALAISVDKTGMTFINKFWNPRVASGWAEAQSASAASLAQAKQEGPASLRDRDVALGPDDLADMTLNYVDSTGASPFSRAFSVEEGFGPKTVELICVAKGGGLATALQLGNLSTYFNGDKTVVPPVRKRLVANQQVVATNYSPLAVNINADVWAPVEVTSQMIINQLAAVLQPEALGPDGVTFLWSFGGVIALSFIDFQIHSVDPTITKVVLNGWADITLTSRQLPTAGNFTITIHS